MAQVAENHQQPKIKLYWLNDSRAQRIVWLLEELGLNYEIFIFHRDPKTMFAPPELSKVHPLGKAPAVGITFPGQEKETVLVESGLITQYLCDNFPEGSHLTPAKFHAGSQGRLGDETEAWMRYQHLLHYAEGSLMPPLLVALILTIMKGPKIPIIVRPIVSSVADKLHGAFVRPSLVNHLAFLESQLETAPDGGPYLCGNHLSAADILMSFPLLTTKTRLQELERVKSKLLTEYPRVWEYLKHLESEDGYKRAKEKIDKLEANS
ncbi:hypothetical protein OQA88_5877 [Cercophora sp. LCS_1]